MSLDADDQAEILVHTLESADESPPSPCARETAHSASIFILDLLASAKFRATVQFMAQKQVERVYASRVNWSATRAVEQALSDATQVGYYTRKCGAVKYIVSFLRACSEQDG